MNWLGGKNSKLGFGLISFSHETSTQARPYIGVSLPYHVQQGHKPDSIFNLVLIRSFGKDLPWIPVGDKPV
jgi:hypothetical protein